MMINISLRSRKLLFTGVLVLYNYFSFVYSAPQEPRSSVFGELFDQNGSALCEDLKDLGFEGFECTLKSACGEDGYVQRNAIIGDLTPWYDNYDNDHGLDLTNYECPISRRADLDDYYDEYEEDDELVCCRSPAYYGKNDVPLSGKEDSCGYWLKHGFDCVEKNKCHADGHYSTSTDQVITGIRSDKHDKNFTAQFTAATKAKCTDQEEICCRKDTFFEKPFHESNEKVNADYEDYDYMSITDDYRNQEENDFNPTTADTKKGPICNINVRKGQGELAPRISSVDEESVEAAEFGEWPNMCIILKSANHRGDNFDLYQCGASLISPGIILTAAHCVEGKNFTEIKVRCGELDAKQNFTESDSELKPHQDRQAKHISVHPAFNSKNLYNDFALVHLDTPFDLDDHIFPICLPNQHSTPFVEDDDCYAMGYGKDSFGSNGYFSDVLKVAPMITVDSTTCEASYKTLKPEFRLHKSFICARGNGAGTCSGDGGSPLVCPNENGDFIQFGVVAWGEKGCSGKKPDVFSDVSTALGFIDWATKCVEGQDVDLFGLSYFKRWAKRQYCINKGYIEDIKTQLSFTNHPNEVDLRKEWRQYDYENRKFRAAIKNCKTGEKDVDCNVKDYIGNEDDFNEVIERSNTKEIKLNYDDLRRNDVVERSGF